MHVLESVGVKVPYLSLSQHLLTCLRNSTTANLSAGLSVRKEGRVRASIVFK